MKQFACPPRSLQLSCSAWQIGFCGAQTVLQLLLTEELCPSFPIPVITPYMPLLLRTGSQQARNKCSQLPLGQMQVNYLLTLELSIHTRSFCYTSVSLGQQPL